MTENTIYMDNNATTPVDPEVKKALVDGLDLFGNASSMHGPGRAAHHALELARKQISSLLNAEPGELVFTAGGSEANNSVLNLIKIPGLFTAARNRIVTSVIEHPSVLETVKELKEEGIEVSLIPVDSTGKIQIDELEKAVGEDTAIVSIMFANNEIGTIQDLKKITEIAHAAGALMHTDAVQAVGKIPLDVKELKIDYLSLSGHKLYAPKGIGVLYIRDGAPFEPFLRGGHQENGRRAGTYNNASIAALGKAAEIAQRDLDKNSRRIKAMRDKLEKELMERIPTVTMNGHPEDRLPGTLNLSFYGAEGESILLYLDLEGVAVSTGSACATGSLEPSYVILETGTDIELAHGSIRFSLGKFNTMEEVDYVIEKLPPIIERLRRMSTL